MKGGLLLGPGRVLPLLTALVLAGAWPARAAAPPCGEGEPLLQYFSPRDYNGGTQCLSVGQDARGVMYVGSLGVVLEYDGSTWRKVDIDSNWASAIACDAATGTVYVGAQNNLGYLKLLPGGERVFVSMLDQLPAEVRDVGAVFGVYATPGGVFFIGTHRVMRWRDGRFRTWELSGTDTLESGWAGGALLVFSPETGLLRLEGDAFVSASDDPLFRRAHVSSILAGADGSLLVATRAEGLCTLRDGVVHPWEGECGDFLRRAGISQALRLRDGSLAVATARAGLLVLDAAGRFRSRLDENTALHGKQLFCLFEDAEGGLWIGMQSGVARVEVDSPLSVLRAGPNDDMSSAYCAGRWSGATVVGNDAGLFRVAPADPAAAVGAHLEFLPGTTLSSTAVCTVENGLLTVTGGKVTLLDGDARTVPAADGIGGVVDLCASRAHPGRVYVIDNQGQIHALRLDAATGRWVVDRLAVDLGVKGGYYGMVESPRGDLWVGTTEHGLFRVQFAPDGRAQVTPFLDRPGPMQGIRSAQTCIGGGPLRVYAMHTLCGLDDSGQELRVLKEFGERFNDGSFNIGGCVSADESTLWLTATDARNPTGESLRGRAIAGGKDRAPAFRPLPRKVEETVGKVGTFHPLDVPPDPQTALLLVGTTGNGVLRLDLRRWDALPPPRPFATFVRRVVAAGGNLAAAELPLTLAEPLPYARNTVHFEFAAGTVAFGAVPRFQTRLAGFGAGAWSDFTERTSVDYLNLPEGRYVFEVRARNADGQPGSLASLPFRVLPPWQRSPWAYALYALAAAAALAGFIRWRGRQLRRRNAVLATLVDARTSELRGRETELVRARDDAEAANRAKSAFLANMSHELRTPLNAVLGYTQLLLKQADLTPRSRERIGVIGQSGGHLLSLVNEVLDLSKVEAGKLTVSPFDFSLHQLLDETMAVFRPRLAEKRLSFEENRAPDLPATVHTDASRLRQVLFNLLSNAAKFTQSGGVTLSVRPAGEGRVRFEVADTGVGIAPEEQRDIFRAFYQAGESYLASQGTGLGLTISQRLVELLGGRIELESIPGKGSRFWFDLPLPAAASGSSPSPVRESTLGKVTGYEGVTRRLLLVDDLAENRRVLRDFLQPLGFEIEEAADGAGCLEACARAMPDIVLLDLRLGAMDGFEVARTLRLWCHGAPLGIVAISASVFESDRQQAIDAGCDDFLPKPFEEAQLLGVLGRVLGLRWVLGTPPADAGPSAAPAPAAGENNLPAQEADHLRELSLRGDAAGIRRRLDALRASDLPASTRETVRQLDALVAAFDMEGIHELLLTCRSPDGNE